MALGKDVLRELPGLRQEANSLMVDWATITRGGGPPAFDPVTGTLTPSAGSVIYSGRCRLRQPSAIAATVTVMFGEQQVTASRFVACFPIDCTDANIGDLITFDDSTDPDVMDRTFRIVSVPVSTYVIDKSYACEVVES